MDHFLVDYENIGEAGLKGIDSLGPDTSIVIFYSEHADKISFDMHQVLCRCRSKVEYRKAETGKKNALDFQLSTYLGFLLASNPNDRFYIVSKDNGYRVVMDFWNKSNVSQIDYIGRAYEQARGPAPKPEARTEQRPERLQIREAPAAAAKERNNETPMTRENLQIVEAPKEAPREELKEAPKEAPWEGSKEVPEEALKETAKEELKEAAPAGEQITPEPVKRQYHGGRRRNPSQKEAPVDEFKPSEELMSQLSQLIDSQEEREDIGRFIVKYKTKQGVNNAIVKKYGTERAGELYKKIKPLLKDKKGK